jgi:hypothetical protein
VIIVIAIVVAWIVILGPSLLRRRATQGDGIASITHFHRALRILERRSPDPIVAPAYRLRAEEGEDRGPIPGGRPQLTVVGAKDLPRPALAFLADGPAPVAATPVTVDTRIRDRDTEHLRTLRRRRDTLGVLVGITGLTLAIGLVPGARMAWVVTLLAGATLGGYVWMLVRIRRQAELRARTVSLDPPVTGAGGWDTDDGTDDPEALARSWADHPVNQVAVGGG